MSMPSPVCVNMNVPDLKSIDVYDGAAEHTDHNFPHFLGSLLLDKVD